MADPLAELQKRYPWPDERPPFTPIDWALDGGGKHLVIELFEGHDIRLILEIGSFLGGSVKTWLETAPEAVVLALDPWELNWAEDARRMGRPESEVTQLDRPDGGYQTFLANLWDHRDRVIPIRGFSPDKLYELHELGVRPDLVFIDNDKSGRELEVLDELFPKAIVCGDDWNWGAEKGYPIRRPVRAFCRKHGRYLKVSRHTWVTDTRRPPLGYRLARARENCGRMRRRLKRALGLRARGRSG